MSATPNILMIITDQQAYDSYSFLGHRHLNTPNLDRLAQQGVAFTNAYCTYPLCSPSRSSFFTGRMPSETGVIRNALPIHPDIPNLGQVLRKAGYETIHVGKWHLPESAPVSIPGFEVVPVGHGNGTGLINDPAVSRVCQSRLLNDNSDRPFFMVASFLEPHGICANLFMHRSLDEITLPPIIENELPELPPNFEARLREPRKMGQFREKIESWENPVMWRYYLWYYYRMVEMVDAEIGRVLRALELSGKADDTVVIFVSDHGEGQGGHALTHKNFLHDEAVKMGLIISDPHSDRRGEIDSETLISGLDLMSTVCDYARVEAPEDCLGTSLKPLMEKRKKPRRQYVVAEANVDGRMVRSSDFKYISYANDPVKMLFNMKEDPYEMYNLTDSPDHATVLQWHQKALEDWENRLNLTTKSMISTSQ